MGSIQWAIMKMKGRQNMRTKREMEKKYADFLLNTARSMIQHPYYPDNFIKKARVHLGCIGGLTPFLEPEQDGLERKNLVVAVLGDSITAGHFETIKTLVANARLDTYEDLLEYFFIDIDAVYHEQLKRMLWEEYPVTPISFLNMGVAGDTIEGMEARLTRDVIRYQPDLVILNGSMNFSKNHGNTSDYRRHFRSVVERIMSETDADLILVTPNMAVKEEKDLLLEERVEVIREMAREKKLALADAYKVWEELFKEFPDVDIADCMANHLNHPTRLGHTVFAITIMNLLKDRFRREK